MTDEVHAHGADAGEDAACAVAHGEEPTPDQVAHGEEPTPDQVAHGAQPARLPGDRVLVAVFAGAVSGFLLRYAADAGYRCLLVEPDAGRAADARMAGFEVAGAVPSGLGDGADVVVTDHHREELGVALRDALATKARWVGIMGNPRHEGPHIAALAALGVPPREVARVHRPIGLNIGSRTPAEIAIATLAGLIADRNARPGGFAF
jgi:xanthine/CO dehydrogenase XdhC/CoxF family maturation factor